MLSRSLLSAAVLTTAAVSQVPLDYLVVGERASGAGPAIHYVDPVTGIATPVVGHAPADTMKDCLTVCVDPSDPTTFYAGGATSGFLGGDVFPIVADGNRHTAIQNFRPTGMPGFAFPKQFRRAPGNSLMMTVSGGSNNGLYEIDLAALTVQRLSVTLPNFASDIAVIGSKVYANSDDTTSSIVEWDLLLGSGRTVGATYPTLKSLAVRTGKLLAGTATGDILVVDPASGQTTPFFQSGINGAVVAIATRGGASDPVWFAIDNGGTFEVYSTGNLSTPLYATSNAITDLDVGVHDQPSFLVYGAGCTSSLGTTPTFEYVNAPAIGAQFTLRCDQVPNGALAFCLLGALRQPTPIDLTPFGGTGCSVYVDSFAQLPSFGTASLKADAVLPIPNVAALAGLHLQAQWAMFDSGNPLGVVTSDANESIVR